MEKLIVCLYRLPDMSVDEFLTHWRMTHAPLIKTYAKVLCIHKYVQLFPQERGRVEPPPTGSGFDGVAEIWFNQDQNLDVAHSSSEARAAFKAIRNDENLFIDRKRSISWWGKENLII